MEENKEASNVMQLRMTRDFAIARVHELSKDSGNLRWTRHIRERMLERGIDTDAVLRVLRSGDIDQDPVAGDAKGEWIVKLTRKMTGGRTVGIVTILLKENRLRLVTAEWEDLR